MTFAAIIRDTANLIPKHQQNQMNHFNPIRNINKGFKKGYHYKQKIQVQHPKQQITIKTQIRFSSLSKDKQHCSEVRFNNLPIQYRNASNRQTRSKDKSELLLRNVRRKLFMEQIPKSSRQNSMGRGLNFSDIIRLSRQKKIQQYSQSKTKMQTAKSLKPPLSKDAKSFNSLKRKLIGQNNPNLVNLNQNANTKQKVGKALEQTNKPRIIKEIEQKQMVRISSQFQSFQCSFQLNMQPTL